MHMDPVWPWQVSSLKLFLVSRRAKSGTSGCLRVHQTGVWSALVWLGLDSLHSWLQPVPGAQQACAHPQGAQACLASMGLTGF